MKRYWMKSMQHEFGLAGIASFILVVPNSLRAAQDLAAAPRLRAADEFVLARTPASATAEVASDSAPLVSSDAPPRSPVIDLEHRLTSSFADALAASPAPKTSAPQDPTIPHHPALTDRYYIGLGGYFATSSTEAELKSPSGIGTSVNFEDTLGLSEREWTPQALARFRMTANWRLELEFFSLHRSGSQTIGGQIDWGGQTYPIGAQVDSKFNIDVTRLSAGYSFFKRPDKEIGIAFGLHLTNIDVELSSAAGGSAKGAAALAPLPVFSLYGQIALTDTWAIDGRFDAFKIEYDPYQGSIFSSGLDVVYQPWRHVGFGLGYRALNVDASVDKSDWNGSVNTGFQGPIAFIFSSF